MVDAVTSTIPYRNITISGLPGSGSTTLLNSLREALKFDGWKGFSGGEFMRLYAEEHHLFDTTQKKHHDSTIFDDAWERQVDMDMRQKLIQEHNWIIESWLAGFLAQGVSEVVKILVICSDDSIRIDRIVNRDMIDVAHAKQHIHERKEKNEQKWRRMYKQEWQHWVVDEGTLSKTAEIDFWDPALYDVVIDTYATSPVDTLEKVLHVLRT